MNRKQLLILFIGAVIFIIIFTVILFFQQSNQQTSPQQTTTQATQQTNETASQTTTGESRTYQPQTTATITQQPLTAAETAKVFYYSLLNTNSLAGGGYKTNNYLSSDFKEVVEKLYNNGDTPVFCAQNKRSTITIGKEQQVFYNEGYLTQVVISDASSGQDLYRVLLQGNGDKWYIFDVNCIY